MATNDPSPARTAWELAEAAKGTDYYGDEAIKERVDTLAKAVQMLCDLIDGGT